MQLTVEGKQLDVGDALREHVRTNLTETAEKYFRNPIEATVVFSKEGGHLFRADISIHVGKGIILQAQHAASDPYPAFDTASDRLAKQLRRYKNKLKDHHKELPEAANMDAIYYTIQGGAEEPEPDPDEAALQGEEPAVIAEMKTHIQTMSVSDAVMRLDLADQAALLFRHPSSGRINLVYRRQDGNIGWVDPKE